MNPQLKKGILELVVLLSISKKDMYGYEIVSKVASIIDVKEGTIYPLLRRLTGENYFDTYLMESNEGPPRKYYHLTEIGREQMESQKEEWLALNQNVMTFLEEVQND